MKKILERLLSKKGENFNVKIKKIKYINLLLSALILIVIIAILYFSRFIFFYKYDREYYENWYYHSQWNYPQSARGISDGELYKFVGFRLAEGENPFNINYEVPPFGKYLYGLSEKFLGTPYPVTVVLYLSSVGILFLLLKKLFPNIRLILSALLLFVTTPFLATQIKETMLDLPLMTFYLAHVFFFIKYLDNKKLLFLGLAGIFLGLASGTKLAVYTLPILILASILLFGKRLPFYFVTVILGYIIAYTPYFLKHPNPIPWLRIHEKVITFYQISQPSSDFLNEWRSIFLNSGRYNFNDWSLILPIGTVITFLVFWKSFKRRDRNWIYISGIALIFLITNSLIPFWPRYLMPAAPLFVLLIAFLFRRFSILILLLAVLNLPFLFNSLNSNNPKGDFEASARFLTTRAYRELYRSIDPNQRKDLSEEKFINTTEEFLDKLNVRSIEVKLGEDILKGNSAYSDSQIIYYTEYGKLENNTRFEFVKINNQWKMRWNWDYLWPMFNPGNKIIVNKAPPKNTKAVYIVPRVISDWGKGLSDLSQITSNNIFDVKNRLETVVPDKYPRFVGILSTSTTKALSIPGVSLRDENEAEVYIEKSSGEKVMIPFKR